MRYVCIILVIALLQISENTCWRVPQVCMTFTFYISKKKHI